MKNILKFNCAIAVIATLFSCAKEVTPIQDNDIPQGYVKMYFDAGVVETVETKAFIGSSSEGRTSVHWTGNEAVNIWYKDANGAVAKVAAAIVSCDGSSAKFYAIIPEDANMDEFYADVNGVCDATKLPFGKLGTDSARNYVPQEQQAVLNSFDPDAASLGARWVRSKSDEIPSFTFHQLTNMLKISLQNNTGKNINKIVLTSSTDLKLKSYWDVENGNIKISPAGTTTKELSLNGEIQTGTYYFVIPTKSTFTDMSITFHYTDGSYRTFTNRTPLEIKDYSRCYEIGNFVLNADDLEIDDSTFAPFGTSWGTGAVKNAKKGDDGKYVATANNGGVAYFTCAEVNQYGNNIKGQFTFEFYTKDSGTGVLTFNTRGGAATHTCSVYVNDNKVGDDITYSNSSDIVKDVRELTVSKGDKISIVYNDVSGGACLFFWCNNAANPVTWTVKSAE